MQKADSILKNVSFPEIQETPVKPGESSTYNRDYNGAYGSGQDHIDAINQMFAEFELAYHNQYHKAYTHDKSVGVAKKYWLSCLGSYTPEVILNATRKVVAKQEYLPSVATLVQACQAEMKVSGLPSAHDAYVEACFATVPKVEYNWSHAAVYLAGKGTGWFELESKAEAAIFPLFEYHYKILCKRLLKGENLTMAIPQALPTSGTMAMTVEDKQSRLEKLRKSLGF